jgi:hypothetical protein
LEGRPATVVGADEPEFDDYVDTGDDYEEYGE